MTALVGADDTEGSDALMTDQHNEWWQDAVVYQIYPRSFQDSNGDGIGDIPGIIRRLDYIKHLGVDAIWLSPVYRSPNDDNGYDISDYQAIMDEFGTMRDMERLIEEAWLRGIRIIMDLVVNHTSDEHPWFVNAKQGKDSEYRNYYIWRDPVDGHEPNGLQSAFGGSAWQFDEHSGQYYLHLFSRKQPDLNWANPSVRDAVYRMMNYWIDKGVGGFRMDVIDTIGKVPDECITSNGPHLHEYLQEMNRATFGGLHMLTVGETWSATPEIAKLYSDPARHELSMVFQFEQFQLDEQEGEGKWDLKPLSIPALKLVMSKWQRELGDHGWNSLFWENHDLPRIVSRWGDDRRWRERSAKMFAILLHLMKGTPYIYQGEEIGMTNYTARDIDEVRDIESVNMYHDRVGNGHSREDALRSINAKGRDNARTPMQWNGSRQAGFTTGTPWLHVNPNYHSVNVDENMHDPQSVLAAYRALIALRKNNPIVVRGDFTLIDESPDDVFAYYRELDGERWLIVANMSGRPQRFTIADDVAKPIIQNIEGTAYAKGPVELEPYEAFALQCGK